jgi:hypothetical protein
MDACYYNDYDFTISRQKVRRVAGASAPPGCISFKKAICLLYWNASQKSRRGSRESDWDEIGYWKGRKRKGKGREKGATGKEKGVPQNFLRRKSCTILDVLGFRMARHCQRSLYFVLGSSCWSRRKSVGLWIDWVMPRDSVCACTDSGSSTTREQEDDVATHSPLPCISLVMVVWPLLKCTFTFTAAGGSCHPLDGSTGAALVPQPRLLFECCRVSWWCRVLSIDLTEWCAARSCAVRTGASIFGRCGAAVVRAWLEAK